MLSRQILAFACAAAAFAPFGATAQSPITIGFPIPLSGPASVYGQPILKGAELAVADINKKGGVLGRQLQLLPRDSKANADEAVRVARELIIKDNVNFLAGVLTSSAAPAVSTVAKENKIVFITPIAKTVRLTAPENLHPYIFRLSENTTVEGAAGAHVMSKWKGIKTVATIAPDYAYGRDAVSSFVAYLKKLRPDIKIVDQQWPKLGQANFTPFITAQMGKHPDAVYCDVYGGDFVSLVKQATPLGYFKAIHNRLADGAEAGTVDEAVALGSHYPYGIWSEVYDPAIWTGKRPDVPPGHKAFEARLRAFMKSKYGSSWAIQGYQAIVALTAGIKKAGSTNNQKVAQALLGLTYETPVGPRTINPKTHETDTGEFWGEMVKLPAYGPVAIMKNPQYLSAALVLK
jgi:branched-chain amino acid transport system substrate-binding protein